MAGETPSIPRYNELLWPTLCAVRELGHSARLDEMLVSFPIFFQCKRYKGAVGPDKVRDFRGAMAGRGDKGLLITTGTFTREARVEATRDGAPPIDLIDGEQLCELLKQHQLGVRTEERRVEDVKVVASFFDELG
jgi:restriction system protein